MKCMFTYLENIWAQKETPALWQVSSTNCLQPFPDEERQPVDGKKSGMTNIKQNCAQKCKFISQDAVNTLWGRETVGFTFESVA